MATAAETKTSVEASLKYNFSFDECKTMTDRANADATRVQAFRSKLSSGRRRLRKGIQLVLRPVWKRLPLPMRSVTVELFLGIITDSEKFVLGMPTFRGLLENARAAGFTPRTTIDVGANIGQWSRMAAKIYPDTRIYMFDADPDNEIQLKGARAALGANAEYAITLLGPDDREAVTFYKSGAGSSVLPELTTFERTEVTLPMCTLDSYMDARSYQTPVLLKLDVQGFELEVLRGASALLEAAELVVLEASLLPYNEGGPLLCEVVGFMQARGFEIFDFCGQARRETDHTLYQTDVAFVKRDSALRAPSKFWLREP